MKHPIPNRELEHIWREDWKHRFSSRPEREKKTVAQVKAHSWSWVKNIAWGKEKKEQLTKEKNYRLSLVHSHCMTSSRLPQRPSQSRGSLRAHTPFLTLGQLRVPVKYKYSLVLSCTQAEHFMDTHREDTSICSSSSQMHPAQTWLTFRPHLGNSATEESGAALWQGSRGAREASLPAV